MNALNVLNMANLDVGNIALNTRKKKAAAITKN